MLVLHSKHKCSHSTIALFQATYAYSANRISLYFPA